MYNELIPLKVYGFDDIELYISLEQAYKELAKFLTFKNIRQEEIQDYINFGMKKHIDGRTKLFPNDDLVLVKMNYFDNNIRSISILLHEIVHAAKRILDVYESSKERKLENREEAEAYLIEYIFEEIMIILKPKIDYTKRKRDLAWFYEITHKLQKIE